MSDELKIVLEDVKEKFDTVIEAVHMVREDIGRFKDENKQEHEELRKDIVGLQADMVTVKKDILDLKTETSSIRQDLHDHRSNTELHNVKGREKAG
jgi:archaellum component FlaC